MDPFIIRRGIASQIAMHYVANHEEIGAQSKKELCKMYGCSESTMRTALREADQLLHAQGKTLTVPEGHSAWRIDVTDDQKIFVTSTVARMTAMAHEMQRYTDSEVAVMPDELPDDVRRYFGDVTAAVELLVDVLAEAEA